MDASVRSRQAWRKISVYSVFRTHVPARESIALMIAAAHEQVDTGAMAETDFRREVSLLRSREEKTGTSALTFSLARYEVFINSYALGRAPGDVTDSQ
jgi:hypothetical protein